MILEASSTAAGIAVVFTEVARRELEEEDGTSPLVGDFITSLVGGISFDIAIVSFDVDKVIGSVEHPPG